MIRFIQKTFSEYDAMRSLYVELMKDRNAKQKYGIIDSSALIPILRGNNIVIERFVISTQFGRKDRYRMYLKIGAKAKLPDEVRLPSQTRSQNLGRVSFRMSPGAKYGKEGGGDREKTFSDQPGKLVFKQKEYKGGGGGPVIGTQFEPYINLSYDVKALLGDALKYDKKERSLVLEFNSVYDAIKALDILPFGINYKIYLLNL